MTLLTADHVLHMHSNHVPLWTEDAVGGLEDEEWWDGGDTERGWAGIGGYGGSGCQYRRFRWAWQIVTLDSRVNAITNQYIFLQLKEER